jgi:hypothetical protein
MTNLSASLLSKLLTSMTDCERRAFRAELAKRRDVTQDELDEFDRISRQ